MEKTLRLAVTDNRGISRSTVLASIVATAFTIYSALGGWLWHAGFVSTPLLFLAEKMAIANDGAPSRIIGAAFVYPPLALALMAPFHNPIVGQAALGASVDGLFILWAERHIGSIVTRRLTQFSFLGSGIVLYTAIEDSGALLSCALAALATFALLRFFEKNYSPDLFAAGTFVGLTFFIDFRVIALAIVFVPTLVWTAGHTSRDKFVAVLITLVVPSFLMALGWTYVNWIFIGDPFGFAHGPAAFYHIRAAELPIHRTYTTTAIVALALMLSPVLLAPLSLRKLDRRTQIAANFMIAASSAWATWCATQTPTGSITIWLVPLGVAIAFAATRGPSIVFQTALIVSAVGSWLFLSTDRADAGNFYRSLTSLAPVASTARWWTIASEVAGGHHVLIDDAQFYGVVALSDNAGRFILPYSRSFETALKDPERFADRIVVLRSANDRIVKRYPSAAVGVFPGFHVATRTGDSIVFTRNSVSPSSPLRPASPIPPTWRIAYLVICALFALGTIGGMRYTSRELTGRRALQQ